MSTHRAEPLAPTERAAPPPPFILPAGAVGWRRTFAALRERDYAWYFAGNAAFFMAMQMNNLLRGYLAFQLTDAASALGLIAMSMAVPMLLVAPIGGVLADRLNKLALIAAAQSVIVAVNLVVAILILSDRIEFWHLVLGALGTGVAISLAMPARQALVPQLVPQHKLMNAISLQMAGMNLTRIVGPALAGLLIGPLGVGVVWSLSVGLYLFAIATLLPLPRHGMVARGTRRSVGADLTGGFRYILATPLFRLLILTGMVMPLFAFPVQLILPVFADDVFEGGAGSLGVLMAASGVGGLAGALIAANLDYAPRKGRVMLAGSLLMGVCLIAFALAPGFLPALLFLAVGNVGGMLFMVTNNAVIQAKVPDEFRGRVMSVLMMSFGMMPLGVLPLTVAADLIGARAAVALSSTTMLVVLAAIFTLSRRLRDLNVEALGAVDLSPAQAARLVAEGVVTQEEADRRSGRLVTG